MEIRMLMASAAERLAVVPAVQAVVVVGSHGSGTAGDEPGAVGMIVTLGHSGNIGQTALALGHVEAFSVGIGMGERVDHASAIGRPVRPAPDDGDAVHFGAQARVYLPDPAVLVDRRHAQVLLANREIRGRISCRLGNCGDDIAGPAADPREHYLHSRSEQVAQLLGRPSAWRLTMELDRLQRALDLREIINRAHLPDGAHPLKTRTLRSLLEDIAYEQRMSA